EYALALIDRGDCEEALAFIGTKVAELTAVGRARAAHHMAGAKIDALLRLGRNEEALAASRAAKDNAVDENDRISHTLDCAVSLTRLGRHQDALAELPVFGRVVGTHSLYERWSQAVTSLALAGAMDNTWKLDAQLFELSKRLRDNGVLRMSADLAERRA